MGGFILKVRRGETPFYAALRAIGKRLIYFDLPVPRAALPLLRAIYQLHWALWRAFRTAYSALYAGPVFRGRCETAGRRLFVHALPHVSGHARISIGSDVKFYGKVGVVSARVFDNPGLIIGNNVAIGHLVHFLVNREIVIEDNVMIASKCTLSDNDGHPRDPQLRATGLPSLKDDIKPVRICRNAWLGEGCQVRKGVTVGEGAIIGVNSVVLTDIPANSIAMGVPARVVGFVGGS